MTTEPAWYKLGEVEHLLRCSRDTLTRFINAGLLDALGTGRGKRITAASYRRLAQLIDEGIDVWQLAANHEKAPARLPTGADRFSTTARPAHGISNRPPPKAKSGQRGGGTKRKPGPDWIKKII